MFVFECTIANAAMHIKADGKIVGISFLDNGNGTGRYATNSEAVANAIKALPSFGVSVFEKAGSRNAEASKVEAKVLTPVESVTRTQEANKYLVENFAVDKTILKDKATAIKVAEENGICFPNL